MCSGTPYELSVKPSCLLSHHVTVSIVSLVNSILIFMTPFRNEHLCLMNFSLMIHIHTYATQCPAEFYLCIISPPAMKLQEHYARSRYLRTMNGNSLHCLSPLRYEKITDDKKRYVVSIKKEKKDTHATLCYSNILYILL